MLVKIAKKICKYYLALQNKHCQQLQNETRYDFQQREKNQQEPLEDFFSSEKIRHITKSRVLSFNANGSNYDRMKCLQKKKKQLVHYSQRPKP